MSKLTIPSVGTLIACRKEDMALSNDDKTYICRISYDEQSDKWVVQTPEKRRGLLVFLNEAPTESTNYVAITAIQSQGKAAYGDPVFVSKAKSGVAHD